MKVIVDANVWLSYLLSPSSERVITRVVRACLSTDIDLIVPQELIVELREILTNKPHFQVHVSQEQAEQFFNALSDRAEILPSLHTVASYVRDPDDDYLIAHGLMFDVDYIVTGDMAVRLLSQVGNLRIVTPAEFIDVLEHSNLI